MPRWRQIFSDRDRLGRLDRLLDGLGLLDAVMVEGARVYPGTALVVRKARISALLSDAFAVLALAIAADDDRHDADFSQMVIGGR